MECLIWAVAPVGNALGARARPGGGGGGGGGGGVSIRGQYWC